MGFYFDSQPVGGELAAVQKVVEKYVPALESGSLELNTWYPEFILQLKMAGIDKVIQEKQRQYDAWLEESRKAGIRHNEGM